MEPMTPTNINITMMITTIPVISTMMAGMMAAMLHLQANEPNLSAKSLWPASLYVLA